MALQLIKDDILNFKADAIVNFISPEQLRDKSFFSSNLFEAAGPKLQYTLARWENLFQVSAAITRSYDLTGCRFIIHALGLDYPDPNSSELQQFEKSIEKVLDIAKDYRCKTLAFSLPGHYRLDASEKSVYSLLTGKIKQFLLAQDDANDMTIYLCIPGGENADAGSSLHDEVTQYVSQNYIDLETDSVFFESNYKDHLVNISDSIKEKALFGSADEIIDALIHKGKKNGKLTLNDLKTLDSLGLSEEALDKFYEELEAYNIDLDISGVDFLTTIDDFPQPSAADIDEIVEIQEEFTAITPNSSMASGFEELSDDDSYDIINETSLPKYKEQDKSFIEMVDWWLNEKNIRMKDFYIHSNLNRAMISNLRCHPGQVPKKTNAIACAIGLELNLEETTDLLDRAGFSLSKYVKTDVIVEYFIKNGIFDIFKINEELFANDLVLLGTN